MLNNHQFDNAFYTAEKSLKQCEEIVVDVDLVAINQGHCRSYYNCPITIALQRHFLPEVVIGVSRNIITLEFPLVSIVEKMRTHGYSHIINTPLEGVKFIIAFDNKQAVKPFSFKLKAPSMLLKPQSKREYKVLFEIYSLWRKTRNPAHKGAYEYNVSLVKYVDSRHVYAQWDSFTESRNEGQNLTKEQCLEAIAEIAEGVQNGNAHDWFDFKA